jgi:phenylpropionate dioxygenase-like ring-hydroxylating dioxygenase large terminal subunit
VQELLEREKGPVPKALNESYYEYTGSEDLAKERYYSREFADLEARKMWNRTWQFACREDEIREPGDFIVYDVADYSLLVVRTHENEIKALHNVCLHRGRLLRTQDGNASQFRCPYHAWSWEIDGRLKEVPCRWDFSRVSDEEFALPEARVGTWGGFVFINMDPHAMPLDEYLDPIPEHFKSWALEDRYKAVHVGKMVDANWKVALEAFIESYHVIGTHPQILPSTGDANTQYDIYRDRPHFNRMITAFGVSSPHLKGLSEQKIVDSFMAIQGVPAGSVVVPDGVTAREFLANMMRGMVGHQSGKDLSGTTDSEMLDAIQYFVFPNFFPWGGYYLNIVYRFRPVRNDPDRALMECILLQPVPPGSERPPPAKMRLLGPDEDWTEAPELGGLGAVFQQDWDNIPLVQRGLKAMTKPGVTLGDYQESRVRHLHRTLDAYLYERDE